MNKVCAWCQKPIISMSTDTMHIHHDNDHCRHDPFIEVDDSQLLAHPEMLGEVMDQVESDIIEHEMFCDRQLYYHSECCRKCGKKLVSI